MPKGTKETNHLPSKCPCTKISRPVGFAIIFVTCLINSILLDKNDRFSSLPV